MLGTDVVNRVSSSCQYRQTLKFKHITRKYPTPAKKCDEIFLIKPLPRLKPLLIFTEIHNPHLDAVTLYGLGQENSRAKMALCSLLICRYRYRIDNNADF